MEANGRNGNFGVQKNKFENIVLMDWGGEAASRVARPLQMNQQAR
jgi:hypothetical protein